MVATILVVRGDLVGVGVVTMASIPSVGSFVAGGISVAVGIKEDRVVVGGGPVTGDDWIIRIINNVLMTIMVKKAIPLTEIFFSRFF